MKKLLATALLLTAGLSTSAHAGFISGSQTTAGGKTVNLQGLEWMPLTYTAGLSRNQVEAAGGFTDRFGGVWNAGDWRYATRAETETLLGSLWGGKYNGWSYDNFDGASAFLNLFGTTSNENPRVGTNRYSYFLFGNAGECSTNLQQICYGFVNARESVSGNYNSFSIETRKSTVLTVTVGNIGYFTETQGLNASLSDTNNTIAADNAIPFVSSLLVRTVSTPAAPVTSPTTLSLFALGFAALLLRRRKTV